MKPTRPLTKKYTFPEALEKLRAYCGYQERCHQEVRYKAYGWGLDGEDADRLAVQLMDEGLLNEERYAISAAGGRFRQKAWGRRKISQLLTQKGVSKNLLKTALAKATPEGEYESKLFAILTKKEALLKADPIPKRKLKLARFAMQKGYESDLVWKAIAKITGSPQEDD